jgi:hypothetical protein
MNFSEVIENRFVSPEKVLTEDSKYLGAVGLDKNFHITVWQLESSEKVNVLMYTDYNDFGVYKCVRLSDEDMDKFNDNKDSRIVAAAPNTNGYTHTVL